MVETGVAARRSAIYLLDQILGDGRLMPELLAAGALDRLEPDDRARAQRLAQDVLRGLERADRLLSRHLRKPPPLSVRNALRLGTVELCQGGAAHGVVHSLVTIVAGHRRHAQLKGLVNAVLRKVVDQGPKAWDALRVPRLPKWLRGPLIEAWGADAVVAMERSHFAGAAVDLTVKSAPEIWAETLGGEVLPSGSVRLRDVGQISALPGFQDGNWWVQDAAAAIPVTCLDPQPGERVIDLCAAPGGKTLQIAASGAETVAVDLSEARMARVRENLVRTGLTGDLRVGDALAEVGTYDAVLLDAPCSATGTIRRHPDLPHAKDGSDFLTLFGMQRRLIDHAWTLLRPGGRMVYCTCSLLPDEGEVQVEEALARLPGATTDRDALNRPGLDPAWITPEGGLRLRPDFWPERGGMDGFYIAVLRKPV